MRINVQIAVESAPAQPEVIQQVARLERGPFIATGHAGALAGRSPIDSGRLGANDPQHQAAEFIAQAQRCPRCGRHRACKGHPRIVFRTPFGKLTLDSPQLYRCGCESDARESFSPLAECLPERTSPELAYLETKFAALVSYGLSLKVLQEVLLIGQALSTRTIRRQVHRAAERLETELAQDLSTILEALPPGENAPSTSATPLVAGLDGCYVHAAGQPSRTQGWFEVIVGKSLPTPDKSPKCFGFVSR